MLFMYFLNLFYDDEDDAIMNLGDCNSKLQSSQASHFIKWYLEKFFIISKLYGHMIVFIFLSS